MKIKILNLKLKNFKGIKELEVDFQGKDTNIYGANATGKTTIFDAFKWLFFDKDSNDRKDFNIKTLDSNNKAIHFLEHEVQATMNIDGTNTVFKKMFQEKWIKKRGQTEQEFSGHETNYWIDEVPVKKKEYEEKINNLIPESLFKLITDPLYFNNKMTKQEKRELLEKISKSNITDEEILKSREDFKILIDNLEGRTVEDYRKVVQAKIKEYNKEKETIPVRIDELSNTLITEHNINYEEIEKQKEQQEQELQKIELDMTNVQARASENMKIANELATAKRELEDFKLKKETENSSKYTTELINLQNEKAQIEASISNKQNENTDRQLKIEQDQKRKKELYEEWDIVSNQKLEYDSDSFVCPTCKREYETEQKEEIKKQFENNFNIHKKTEQDAINKEGQALNERIKENKERCNVITEELSQLTEKLKAINNKITELEKTKENNNTFDITALPEYSNKIKEIDELQEKVNKLASEDISGIQNKKAEILEKINDLNKTLNEKETQEKTKERIEELKKQEEEISQKVQELEAQQYQIEEFTKTKVEMLENSINSKFKMVKFRLFDTQINQGLKECCDTLVNGVPYNDVNNAHKILAGLDIINTLIHEYGKSAPIFIDNRESINELYDIDAQVISLIVAEDKKLRMEAV